MLWFSHSTRTLFPCSLTYPGIRIVQHYENNKDIGILSCLDCCCHSFLAFQEEPSSIRYNQKQLCCFLSTEKNKNAVN